MPAGELNILARLGSCMQLGPYALACFTPLHGSTACGAFQRNECTGAAAKGIPLNDTMAPSGTPATRPPVTSTSRISARARGTNHTEAITNAKPESSFFTYRPPSRLRRLLGSTMKSVSAFVPIDQVMLDEQTPLVRFDPLN